MSAFTSDIEGVLAINPNAIDARGNLKSLTEQYGEYALAKELDPGSTMRFTPFVLSMNSSIFGVPELAGKPLVLTSQSLKHIQFKHGARIDALNELPFEMAKSLLVYGDQKSSDNVVFVLEGRSENGNRLISIVKASVSYSSIEIAQVRSVHGKRALEKEIAGALAAGRPVHTSTRTGDWLRDPRTLSGEPELSSETRQRLLEVYYTQHPGALAAERESGYFSFRPLSSLEQSDLERAWADLGDALVDDDGCLLSDWRDYPAGIDREEIWLDFDAAYPKGVHALMFPGDREPSRTAEDGTARNERVAIQYADARSVEHGGRPAGSRGETVDWRGGEPR